MNDREAGLERDHVAARAAAPGPAEPHRSAEAGAAEQTGGADSEPAGGRR
jgi:hypothetical protein